MNSEPVEVMFRNEYSNFESKHRSRQYESDLSIAISYEHTGFQGKRSEQLLWRCKNPYDISYVIY